MPPLVSVIRYAARALDAALDGYTTSGGTPTTLIDTNFSALGWAASDPPGWWLVYEDFARRVTAYNPGTSTLTFAPALPAPTDPNQPYMLIRRYPLPILLGKLNEVLVDTGLLVLEDTVATVANQKSYAFSPNTLRSLRQVWLSQNTSFPWEERLVTRYRLDVGGTQLHLLDAPERTGLRLRLVYCRKHDPITAFADGGGYQLGDAINDWLREEYIGIETAVRAARWRLGMPGSNQQETVQQINDLIRRATNLRPQYITIPAYYPPIET